MRTLSTWLGRWLLQREAEQDEGFRLDLYRGSLLSLRMVGLLQILVPLVMLVADLPLIPVPLDAGRATAANVGFVVLGCLSLGVSVTPAGRRWPRLFTLASIWASVAIMLWSAVALGMALDWMQHHMRGYIVLVLFGAAAAVPVRPVHGLALGLAIHGLLLGSRAVAPEGFARIGLTLPVGEQLFLLVLTLLCTALAASVYRQRYVGYCNHQKALQTSEDLRQAENKLLISENAAMMGRVAAALSHELNSPIGALASSVDSLALVARKMAAAKEADKPRLHEVLEDAYASGHASAQRLRGIVGRMQRFTNLDRAEVQSADLNELLRDVIAMAEADGPNQGKVSSEWGDLPRFSCRPQQMSALFSNLLHNALDAVGEEGEVRVTTAMREGAIEILVQDNGKGIDPEQLRNLFDPAAFRDAQGRMKAGNWSLFSCRQIVEEHGGSIAVSSRPGETTFRVVFPRQAV